MSLGSCFQFWVKYPESEQWVMWKFHCWFFEDCLCCFPSDCNPLHFHQEYARFGFLHPRWPSCSYPFIHLFILIIAVEKDTGYTPVFGTHVSDDWWYWVLLPTAAQRFEERAAHFFSLVVNIDYCYYYARNYRWIVHFLGIFLLFLGSLVCNCSQ